MAPAPSKVRHPRRWTVPWERTVAEAMLKKKKKHLEFWYLNLTATYEIRCLNHPQPFLTNEIWCLNHWSDVEAMLFWCLNHWTTWNLRWLMEKKTCRTKRTTWICMDLRSVGVCFAADMFVVFNSPTANSSCCECHRVRRSLRAGVRSPATPWCEKSLRVWIYIPLRYLGIPVHWQMLRKQKWRFPEIGVPLNHLLKWDFPL